jgi:hypothetical protein
MGGSMVGMDGSIGGSMFVPDGGPRDGSSSIPDLPISHPDVPQGPVLRVSPAALPFGEVEVGQASPTLTVTVTNTGALTALTPTVDVAAFAINGTTCSTPAASCTISIVFTPPSATVASGTLIVAPGLTVSLSGTGTPIRAFTATPSAIPGTVLANQPVPFTVTVTATGAIPGLACVPSSANVTADPTKTTCPATVPANIPCAFGFTFKAATAGPKPETIVCSGGTTVRNVSVTTTVVTPPILTIAPTPASFSADVGATSQVTIFSVGNAGGTASGVLTKVIGGANATEFVITNDGCVLPLDSLDTCTIQVVFKPTTPGTKAATITVSDLTGGSTPASATISGVATPGTVGVVISGTQQNLGSVQVGQAGTALVFTVTNRGVAATGALTLATDDPEFAIDSDACSGLPLAAGANCMFTITFTPTTAAAKSAVVTAKSGATVMGTLMITGTGTSPPPGPPALSMTPTTGLNFGSVGVTRNSLPQSLTVTNTGGRATGALTVLPAGSAVSKFSYTTTCAAALAPNSTCQVVVTYKPTVEGDDQATFTVTDGTYSSPTRTVTGTGVTSPGLNITCAGAFDDTVVGQTSTVTRTCTVSNDSASPLATGTLTFTMTGDFATTATTGDCSGKSLAATEQCTEAVVFKPTTAGDLTGSIKVTGANGGTDTATLAGTSLAIIEIQKFTLSGTTLTAVSADPYVFPNGVSVGATSTSDTNVVLAVFVRATGVGNLRVAATNIAAPTAAAGPDFRQVAGAVNANWPNGGGLSSRDACNIGTVTTAITPRLYVPYCTMVVSFTPQTTGTKNGAITASGSVAGTDTANVRGTAGGPISISPSQWDFGSVAQGTAGAEKIFTICNHATASATGASFAITPAAVAGYFAVTLDQVTDATIAAGACVNLALRLDLPVDPSVPASVSATLTVSATVSGNTQNGTAALTGTSAGAPGLQASVTAFPDTPITSTSGSATVTITNNGGLSSGALTFSLPGGSEFAIQTGGTCGVTCPSSGCTGNALASHASCTVGVRFAPTVVLGVGHRTDILSVGSASGAFTTLALGANAVSQLTANPTSITFGASGGTPTSVFTITNNGAAINTPLTVVFQDFGTQTGNTDGVFAFNPASPDCLDTLAAGATCTVGVQMATSLQGIFSTTVVVTDTVNGQSAQVVVTGTSAQATLQFTPATDMDRDLGTVPRDDTSSRIIYTVTNVGGAPSGSITFDLYDQIATPTPHPATTPHAKTTDFSFSGSTCISGTTTLAPGATCNISVAFNPQSCPSIGICSPTAASLAEYLVVTASPGTPATGMAPLRLIKARTAADGVVAYIGNNPLTKRDVYDFGVATVGTAQTVMFALYNPDPNNTFPVPATAPAAPVDITLANAVVGASEFAILTGATGGGTCQFAGGTTGNYAVLPKATPDNPSFCTFRVRWTPVVATTGTRAVSITVGGLSMDLYGRVPGAGKLKASPSELDFGHVSQNSVTATLTLTVTNIGESAFNADTSGNVGRLASGTTAVSYGSGCNNVPLAAGDSCYLAVTLDPSGATPTSSTVTVQSPPTGTAAASVNVNVTWTPTTATTGITIASTGTASFGAVAVLVTSAAKTVTVTNPAGNLPTGPLHFAVVASSTDDTPDYDFAVDATGTGDSCGALTYADGLSGGQACTVTMTFTPRAFSSTADTAALKVTSGSGATATYTFTGTTLAGLNQSSRATATTAEDPLKSTGDACGGGTGTCTYDNTDWSAATRFSSETFTFQNRGGVPTGVLSAGLSGTNPTHFKIITDNCTGTILATGGTCKVTVRFQPTSTGSKTATLTVSGTPGDSAAVNLAGTGT